jgi:hypothetical protein
MVYRNGSQLISSFRLPYERPKPVLFGRNQLAFFRVLKRATTRAVLRVNAVDICFVGRFSVNLCPFYGLARYK